MSEASHDFTDQTLSDQVATPVIHEQEAIDFSFLHESFHRLTPGDVATFYVASAATQMAGIRPEVDVKPMDRFRIREALSSAERSIVVASMDTITREFLSAADGGTVMHASLNSDQPIIELATRLSLSDNPYINPRSRKLFEEADLKGQLGSPKSARVPIPIGETLMGMRLAASAATSLTTEKARVKELARDIGDISTALFAAMNRNPMQHPLLDPRGMENIYLNWLDFANTIGKFGRAESEADEIHAVDTIIYAQHGGAAGDGRMLYRTASDMHAVLKVLDSKDDTSGEGAKLMAGLIDWQLQKTVGRYPQLNTLHV
jgi:hypothetical protein